MVGYILPVSHWETQYRSASPQKNILNGASAGLMLVQLLRQISTVDFAKAVAMRHLSGRMLRGFFSDQRRCEAA